MQTIATRYEMTPAEWLEFWAAWAARFPQEDPNGMAYSELCNLAMWRAVTND